MPSVYRGLPYTFEAHFEDGAGDLVDAVNPRITIWDPLNVAVIVDATPVHVTTGIYQYVWTPALDALLGNWHGDWQGTVQSQGLGPLAEYVEVLPVGVIFPAPSASYTYNLATDVGKVRLYIDDRDMTSVSLSIPMEQRSAIFTDEEITQFLTAEGGSLYLAASVALRTIATNRSLLVQRRDLDGAVVDYGQLRKDLLDAAAAWETKADEEAGGVNAPADGIAEVNWNDFTERRIIVNAQLRQSL